MLGEWLIALFGRSWKFGRELVAELRSWSGRSVNRRIFVAGVSTSFGVAAAKLVFAIRELVIAYQFGAAPVLGAYLIAAVLPTYCAQIVAGSLPLVFVPALIRERDTGGGGAAASLYAMTNATILGLALAVSALMIATFPAYLDVTAARFPPAERALATDLMLVLLPYLVLRSINVAWSAGLGAEKHFLIPALTPAITPAVMTLAAAARNDVSVLAWSMSAGMALETAVVGVAVRRLTPLPFWPSWPKPTAPLRAIFRQVLPIVLGSLLFGAAVVLDQSMAARISAGSVAIIYYASLLILFPVVLASTALGAAVLPYASELVSARNWRGLRHTTFVYLRLVALATLPLTALVFLFAEPLVALVFERGAFASADVAAVADVTRFMALQIPFYIGASVVNQPLSALGRTRVLLWATALGFAIKVALNLALVPAMGLAGIGVATSAMYAVSFAVALAYLLGDLKTRRNG